MVFNVVIKKVFISIANALFPRVPGMARGEIYLISVDLGQKRFPCREAERAARFMRLRRIAPPDTIRSPIYAPGSLSVR